ncbi:MAG: hypothetical protein J5814_05205 [Bacteroidaceae bacterium]|nr:hypothetical protein [Bacteroidaceae bacterium]
MKPLLVFSIVLSVLTTPICSAQTALMDDSIQNESEPVRMDRSKLNIGAYILQLYARTEQHVREIADCGIDFMTWVPYDRRLLDLFQKYHIGAVVNNVVPGWWGGEGKDAGLLSAKHPLEVYEKGAARFIDHPAVWGIDIGDEPSALDFPYYGQVFTRVDELFPHQFPFLNLYPNYASVSQNTSEQTINQLGTPTYREHIAQYVKYVPSDYICYDFYLYSINVHQAYENLRVVADACLGTGRSLWIVLQVNSNKEDVWITENELRFQAFTAMAFGAENILWGCYTAGWWYNNVLDKEGRKTEQYDKLRRVNAEIHRLGPSYMQYRRVRTDFVSFEGTEWLKNVLQTSVPSLSNGIFSQLKTDDNAPLVVGTMLSRSGDGASAVFVCAADDPYDEHPVTHRLSFSVEGRRIKAQGTQGDVEVTVGDDGTYSLDLPSNQAVLIEAFVD